MKKNSPHKSFGFIFIFTFLIISLNALAQVGINTTSPTTVLDVNGALSLRESPTTLELANGINQNIDLGTNSYSQYRITGPTTAFSIKSVIPVNGSDGQILRLVNGTNHNMTIINSSAPSLFNRDILCPGEMNLVIMGIYSSVTLQYSMKMQRWTVLSYSESNSANKYFVKTPQMTGTEDSKINSGWSDLKDMSITFTPVNSFVFLSYSVAGDVRNGALQRTTGKFRLVLNGNEILRTETRTPSLNDRELYHNFLPLYGVSVTPGVPVTIKIEWAKEGNGTIYNNPFYAAHERYLTIID